MPAEASAKAGVYFDDLKVTHTKTNVIQYNACPPKLQRRREYYPFGLQTASSWTRENAWNNFQYNGGSELNTNSGWYETFFRGYDAAMGRFLQVDPLAHMSAGYSPYNYGFNDPVLFNDPLGDKPSPVHRDPPKPMSPDFSEFLAEIGGNPFDGGHWSDQYASGGSAGGQNMTAGEFIGNALYGGYSGGTWSNGQGSFFENDAEATAWAIDNFDSFSGTQENALAKLQGIAAGSSWVHFKYNLDWTTRNGNNVSFKYLGTGDEGGPGPYFQEGWYRDAWNGFWDYFKYLYGIGDRNKSVGIVIYGAKGQKVYIDYSQAKLQRAGVVGVLDLSDPTNPFSALSFTIATNELDALGHMISIWFENPLRKTFSDGKHDPIPYYYPSINHPGYYETSFDYPEHSDAIYSHTYENGRHVMRRMDGALGPK